MVAPRAAISPTMSKLTSVTVAISTPATIGTREKYTCKEVKGFVYRYRQITQRGQEVGECIDVIAQITTEIL